MSDGSNTQGYTTTITTGVSGRGRCRWIPVAERLDDPWPPIAVIHVVDDTGRACRNCDADLFPGATDAQRKGSCGYSSGSQLLILFHEDGSWAHTIDLGYVEPCGVWNEANFQ
jgi:hypothetical protein